MYRAAVVACRCNPPPKRWYGRLTAAGKTSKVARVALARELLTILNAILRDRTPRQATAAEAGLQTA